MGFSAAAGKNDAHTNTSRRHREKHISSLACGAVGQSSDSRPLKDKRTQTHAKRKHKTNRRRIRSLNSPDAFLATRSRNNSTMMLKTCDMSPHRRNIFIDMAPVGLQYWQGPVTVDPFLAWNDQEVELKNIRVSGEQDVRLCRPSA